MYFIPLFAESQTHFYEPCLRIPFVECFEIVDAC
jgi:hypothetical protein